MTIAVGMLANGGVVLAADTQLTYQNYWKGDSGKVMAVASRDPSKPTGACAVTGATTLFEYLHALGDELWKDFLESLNDADKATAFERFEEIVHDFHYRHIAPNAGQDLSVLIAYQRDGDVALWQSAQSVLVEQYEYGAVGIGQFAANSWLGKIWQGRMDIPKAVIAATFAAAVAKESVDGCGKYTHVYVVEADEYRRIDQAIVNEIDQLYEALSSEIQPAYVLECLGEQSDRSQRLSQKDLADRLRAIMQRIIETTPDTVKQWRRNRWARLVTERSRQLSKDASSGQPPSQE